MKKIYILMLTGLLALSFASCSEDDPDGQSIFPTEPVTRDSFDQWLLKNYTWPYNVEFNYKMSDIETDMKYNLQPADSAKAAKLAIIVKYLWFDAYNEVCGTDFVKENVPRVIQLIGTPAYNSEGTIVLGTAEGGLKVTLYMVNSLTDAVLRDYSTLNEYYFHTMHHEFTHILTQKKPYNTAFDLITEAGYISGDWYQETDAYARQQGFVTAYAMSEPNEDFAEMMSVYVTSSDEEWQAIIDEAGDGATAINDKLAILRAYMLDSWNLNIDDMRAAIQHRAHELGQLDLQHLN